MHLTCTPSRRILCLTRTPIATSARTPPSLLYGLRGAANQHRDPCRKLPILQAQEDEVDEEAAFEKRLADLKRAKGETPYGEKRAKARAGVLSDAYSGEEVFYEGGPHNGDLAVNVALGITILWLPLTFASIGRKIFVKYRVTDKRISVMTTAPWANRQTDVSYNQVRDVAAVGRGVGLWGDMVITLKNGDKIEIRSLDRWQEIRDYISKKKTEAESPTPSSNQGKQTPVGF